MLFDLRPYSRFRFPVGDREARLDARVAGELRPDHDHVVSQFPLLMRRRAMTMVRASESPVITTLAKNPIVSKRTTLISMVTSS